MKLPEGKLRIPTVVGLVILSIVFFPIAIGVALMWLIKSKVAQPVLRNTALAVVGFLTFFFGTAYAFGIVSPTSTSKPVNKAVQEVEKAKEQVTEGKKEKKTLGESTSVEKTKPVTTSTTLPETTTPNIQTPAPKTEVSTPVVPKCDPNYSGACVPIASDVDCAGGTGNGPAYVQGPVYVIGTDIYGLDKDKDGIGCN